MCGNRQVVFCEALLSWAGDRLVGAVLESLQGKGGYAWVLWFFAVRVQIIADCLCRVMGVSRVAR